MSKPREKNLSLVEPRTRACAPGSSASRVTASSNSSSLVENLEGAAELVPPSDEAALASAMARVLDDAGLRERLCRRGMERARSFSWRRTALETVACYRELAGRAPSI